MGLRTWQTLPVCPGERSMAASAQTGGVLGYVWVIGGMDGDGAATDTMYRYRIEDDAWTTASPMPAPRYAHTASTAGDVGELGLSSPAVIYITGGLDSTGAMLDSVLSYDTLTDTWSTLESFPLR